MFAFLLTLLIIDALLLSVVVLLQAGQGGGLASLGGATTDTVLGGRQAVTILHQAHLVVRRDLPRALADALAGAARRPVSALQERLRAATPAAPAASAPLPLGGTPPQPPRKGRHAGRPEAPGRASRASPRQPAASKHAGAREPDDRSPRFRFARGRRLVRRNDGAPARSRLRRGGVHHQPHRLSGDVHRSELPRPDRRDDGADDRELRHQSGGHGVGASAGHRRGGARALPPSLQLALHPEPGRVARRRPAYRSSKGWTPAGSPATCASAARCGASIAEGREPSRGADRAAAGLAVDGRTRPGLASDGRASAGPKGKAPTWWRTTTG